MSKEKIFLIIALAVVCLCSAVFVSGKLAEQQDMQKYAQAIKFYQNEDYSNAYYNFGKISGFSSLKSAALFRQARCATFLGDTKSAIRNYSILLNRFPNTEIYPISEYNLAVLFFESKDYAAAKKHFKHIIKNFEDKEVTIASRYYIGIIENDTDLLFEYIKLSPKGRFSDDAINYLIEKNSNLSNAQNLIIAKSYLEREEYKKSLDFYSKTTLKDSWSGFAKAKYKTGDVNGAKQLIIQGLKYYSNYVDEQEIYDCIDIFVSASDSKETTLKILESVNPKAKGTDYIMYLLAKKSLPADSIKIYQKIYTKFPEGKFAAESLYKVFLNKIYGCRYDEAIKLGMKHLSLYNDTNSAPAVMFWLAKVYEKRKNYEMSKSYYKKVLVKYPDSYYAFRANSKLHKSSMFEEKTIIYKPIVFPIDNDKQAELAKKLVKLEDYDFVQELYPNDEFIKSWTEYQKGKYTSSAIIAREAMDKLKKKPSFKDTRWRLVYPIHYYDLVKKYSNGQNPVIILSIIKEESHFNPKARSYVGAEGLMQLMPSTASEIANSYGISNNLYNPSNNIRLGCLYYGKIKQTLNNKDMSAIMAYNGGYGAVQNWKNNLLYSDTDEFVEKIPYPETQQYVKKVTRTYWNYIKIY